MRAPRARAAVAVLAGVLLTAACGGGNGGDANEQPRKRGEAGNLSVYEVSSAGFSLGVPRSWKTVSADTVAEGLKTITAENPEMAPYVQALSDPASPMKLFAADPDVEDGFATNVNVVVTEIPPEIGFDEFAAAAAAEVERLEGRTTPVEQRTVELPAGRAVRFEYDQRLRAQGRTIDVLTIQYGLASAGRAYVVTYSTLPALEERYARDFERSARSLTIG